MNMEHIGPTHPLYYGELLWLFTGFTSGQDVPRRIHQPAPCPNLPFSSDLDPGFVKRLQTLLDVLADISVWEKKNIAATSAQLTQAGATLATHLYVVFNSSDEDSRRSCRTHLWGIFESLRGVKYYPSPDDGSPKLIDERFHGDIAEISSSLHTFAWEVFKPRVTKHRKKLESIKSLVAKYPRSFAVGDNAALSSFFGHLDKILVLVDRLESVDAVPTTFTNLLHHVYVVWVQKNILAEHDSGNELPTVLDRLDVLVNRDQIGCSVRRWALKIMSYEIAAVRLFRLTQSRRLRPILQGEFDVTALESPPPQPPYAFDMSEETIRQALDMALAQSPSIFQADNDNCNAFVDYAYKKAIESDRADRHSPIIHAELAMLSSIEAGTIKAFPYIGVSNLSCLMCSTYLEAYSQTVTNGISVRGCHGKVYPSWAWPTILGTHHESIRSIFLEKIRKVLKQDFERFTEYRRTRRESDNSVGSTSEMEYAINMTPEEIWEQIMGGA